MALPNDPSPSKPAPHKPVASPTQSGPGYNPSQVAASLAANPNASKGGYEGSAPMADPVAGYDPYSVDMDPVLARTHAVTQTTRENARSAAILKAQQLALALGDANGLTDDKNTADAAKANPFSDLAVLKHNYDQTARQHDEDLNKGNLFYSGARARTLADDAYGYQAGQATARTNALNQFGDIQSQLANALMGADQTDMGALNDATNRASTQAATYGYDPGAVTSTSFTPATGTVPTAGPGSAVSHPAAAAPTSPLAAALAKAGQKKLANIPI